jgi:hypothetical protein
MKSRARWRSLIGSRRRRTRSARRRIAFQGAPANTSCTQSFFSLDPERAPAPQPRSFSLSNNETVRARA